MKFILSVFLSLIATSLIAQKQESALDTHKNYEIDNALLLKPKGVVNNQTEAQEFALQELNLTAPYGLKLLYTKHSPLQLHYTFAETFDEIEIYHALIKVNTDKRGNITSIFHTSQKINNQNISNWPSLALNKTINTSEIYSTKHVWAIKDGQFTKCIAITYKNEQGLVSEKLLDSEANTIFTMEHSQHFSDIDTTVTGYVFAPDPITTANTYYTFSDAGGTYIDNNDATNDNLDNARKEVSVTATFDSSDNTFYLENSFVKISELDVPIVPPVTSSSPSFYYDRSQSGFEDFNVLYHITQQQLYIQSLGFDNLVNYQIKCDPHGLNGTDNSVFNPTNPPTIIFGEGGVDDAEDADVIIHEYTHAIMNDASPTNFGLERNALDEAYGDYMAASYSRLYQYYADCCVYNWDGHNEFWNGRKVTSTAHYPEDLQNNLYLDAPIWSSALLRIERNIGRKATHMVTLAAAFNYTGNMTMSQAAELVLEQDSLIYNEQYHGYICYTFLDKGFVSNCKTSRPAGMVSIDKVNLNEFKVINSQNFATGTGNIELVALTDFTILVFDLSGHLIEKNTSFNQSLFLDPSDYKSGIYIVKISFEDEVKSIKISRL